MMADRVRVWSLLPGANAALGLASLAMMTGCATLNAGAMSSIEGRRTYIGVVTVDASFHESGEEMQSRVRQIDVTTIGLRVDHGVSLGYLRDRLVAVPIDCRLVVFIRSVPELTHAERILRAATKEELCVVQLVE